MNPLCSSMKNNSVSNDSHNNRGDTASDKYSNKILILMMNTTGL